MSRALTLIYNPHEKETAMPIDGLATVKRRVKLAGMAGASWLRNASTGRHALGVLYDTQNGLLLAPVGDVGIGRQLGFHGSYDLGAIERYRALLSGGDLLVVGAHIGTVAIPLSGDARRVELIEANPSTRRLLEVNLLINQVENAVVHGVAAHERRGTIEFVSAVANSGGSKIMPASRLPEFFSDRPETIQVPCVALDELLGDRTFDLIIIDVEGAEMYALRGMSGLLCRASALVVEVLPSSIEYAAGLGFEDFLAAIPERFDHFRVVATLGSSELAIGQEMTRRQLAETYRTMRAKSMYAGFDLLCLPHDHLRDAG
jgi:FkbM family methyltransferase